jgi:hypothetical protein
MEEVIQLPLNKEQFFLLMASLSYACAVKSQDSILIKLSTEVLNKNFSRAENHILPLSDKFKLIVDAIDPIGRTRDDILEDNDL